MNLQRGSAWKGVAVGDRCLREAHPLEATGLVGVMRAPIKATGGTALGHHVCGAPPDLTGYSSQQPGASKVPVPLDNPVWYEWDESKEPSCNLGLVRIFGGRTKVLSLGVVLLILGYIFNIGILITIGWILAVIGLVLFVLGAIGRPLAGRRYWY